MMKAFYYFCLNILTCIFFYLSIDLINMMFPLFKYDISYGLLICYGVLVLFASQTLNLLIYRMRFSKYLYSMSYLFVILYWKDSFAVMPYRTFVYLLSSCAFVTIYIWFLNSRKSECRISR